MFKYYKKYVPYLFLLPAGIVLLIFFFIPFFQTVYLSFFDYSSILYTMSKKAKKSVSKKEIHFNSIDAYFIVNNIIK